MPTYPHVMMRVGEKSEGTGVCFFRIPPARVRRVFQ